MILPTYTRGCIIINTHDLHMIKCWMEYTDYPASQYGKDLECENMGEGVCENICASTWTYVSMCLIIKSA